MTARKIIGWVILIPSILATLFMLAALVVGFMAPGDLVTKVLGIIMLVVIALVPAGLTYLGVYLIWLRDRKRFVSPRALE